jgi:hypothetical protein
MRNGNTMSRTYIWNGERHVQFGQPEVESLVSGAGSTDAATEFPAERVTVAATAGVCGSPCQIERIRCVTGTSVALVVYEGAAASSGTQLYSGTLSAGQEAAIPTPIRAINGLRASFASGSFDFYVSQEA